MQLRIIWMLGLYSIGILFALSGQNPTAQGSLSFRSSEINTMQHGVVRIADLPFSQLKHPSHIDFADKVHGMISNGADIFSSDDGGHTWIKRKNFGDDARVGIGEINFVNPKIAWVTVNTDLFKTMDGGATWTAVPNPFPGGSVYSVVFDSSGQRGWASGTIYGPIPAKQTVASNGAYSPDGKSIIYGVLAFTDNGGTTWQHRTVLDVGFVHSMTSAQDGGVWALFDNSVLRLSGKTWIPSDLLKANGDSWRESVLANKKGELYGGLAPLALTFVKDGQGWVSSSNGMVLKTTDGGRTWFQVFDVLDALGAPTDDVFAKFNTLVFCDSSSGWAIDGLQHLYHTVNGGSVWEKLEPERTFGDVTCDRSGSALALGSDGVYTLTP